MLGAPYVTLVGLTVAQFSLCVEAGLAFFRQQTSDRDRAVVRVCDVKASLLLLLLLPVQQRAAHQDIPVSGMCTAAVASGLRSLRSYV